MLKLQTLDEAQRLLRAITQPAFFKQLLNDLIHQPLTLTVKQESNQWTHILSETHFLSRSHNDQGLFSNWATWFDRQSAQPLFIASWAWWLPILRATKAAQHYIGKQRPHTAQLEEHSDEAVWLLMAAVYALGVDEVYLNAINPDQERWKRTLARLPVTVQVLDCDAFSTHSADLSLSALEALCASPDLLVPADWFSLFQLLVRSTADRKSVV